jgi:microcystin-dependent protein
MVLEKNRHICGFKLLIIQIMKMHKLLLLSLFFIGYKINAQIGINTQTPDTSAALHIVAKPYGQGLLIPRLTQAQRIAITAPAKGLMVYDLTDDMYYMNLTAGVKNWLAINPWITGATSGSNNAMYTHSTVANVGIGTQTPTARLDVNGSITSNSVVTTNTLTVPGFPNNALVPAGLICMWSGAPTAIPNGWALCDGSIQGGLQTPDLRGRFIVGYDAGSSTSPVALAGAATANVTNYGAINNTGGENAHTLLKNEMPKHKHVIGNGSDGATLSNSGNHNHNYSARDGGGHETGNASKNLGYRTYQTSDAGDHSHSGVSGDGTTDGLNNQPHENRPPYYVLAFIMKLP